MAASQAVKHGMVVGPHPHTADAGLQILKRGGNAFDAAVAAAFTEAVVQPAHNGIAGYGGCLVAYRADRHEVVSLDFNCRAPRAAKEEMFPVEELRDGNLRVRSDVERFGALAVAVPGIVGGLSEMLAHWGTRPLPELLSPAIRAAGEGFPVNRATAEAISGSAPRLRRDFPETAKLLMPDGRPPNEGDTLKNLELAHTLESMADHGTATFYKGELARQIADYVRQRGGILTAADMAAYQPRLPTPLRLPFRGFEICTLPAATGGPTVLVMLALWQRLSLPRLEAAGADFFHVFLECQKSAWTRRLLAYGDRRAMHDPPEADLRDPTLDEMLSQVRRGLKRPEKGRLIHPDPLSGTSHICVADTKGNVVSLTQTHGGSFGSLLSVPGTGLILGHGMSRFDPRPRRVNSVGPAKEPLHNMSPSLVLGPSAAPAVQPAGGTRAQPSAGGKASSLPAGAKLAPFLAIGAPGGRTIPNNLAYFLLGLLEFRIDLDQALAAPRIHCETAEPAKLEAKAAEAVFAALRAKGHELNSTPRNGGPAHAIQRDPAAGTLRGATDPRGQGKIAAE